MSLSIRRGLLVAVVLLTPLDGTTNALGAQSNSSTLVAGVADAETGQPLENAEVVLVELRRLARANALGEARVEDVPFGTHRVRVRMLGYAPADIQLKFASDTTGAVFRLERTATSLAAMRIEAERLPSGLRDGERRRRRGIGRFLSSEDLAKDRDRDLGTVAVMRFPGLRLISGTGGQQFIMSTRGGPMCPVHVYIDGLSLGMEQDLWFIRTWDLALVEYYTQAQIPPEYRTRWNGCGVLLLWSRWD